LKEFSNEQSPTDSIGGRRLGGRFGAGVLYHRRAGLRQAALRLRLWLELLRRLRRLQHLRRDVWLLRLHFLLLAMHFLRLCLWRLLRRVHRLLWRLRQRLYGRLYWWMHWRM
jgi:hypothetical protein